MVLAASAPETPAASTVAVPPELAVAGPAFAVAGPALAVAPVVVVAAVHIAIVVEAFARVAATLAFVATRPAIPFHFVAAGSVANQATFLQFCVEAIAVAAIAVAAIAVAAIAVAAIAVAAAAGLSLELELEAMAIQTANRVAGL